MPRLPRLTSKALVMQAKHRAVSPPPPLPPLLRHLVVDFLFSLRAFFGCVPDFFMRILSGKVT